MNFAALFERVTSNSILDPLQDAGDEGRSGTIYVSQSPEFWNQLATLANSNAEGLADFLGVNSDQVKTWNAKIEQSASEAKVQSNEKQQTQMTPTGGL